MRKHHSATLVLLYTSVWWGVWCDGTWMVTATNVTWMPVSRVCNDGSAKQIVNNLRRGGDGDVTEGPGPGTGGEDEEI
ncbi:hypothetical protein JB92DRAFT_2930926 [Gautieria morchelliformis]|nr:hypothetical protein JB92DRAFT_2930926 [Gautieria morchelliformis]